jgi:hypothetical protein
MKRARCCLMLHVDSVWLEAGGLLREWLPWLAAFTQAEIAAGWVVRLLKAKENDALELAEQT